MLSIPRDSFVPIAHRTGKDKLIQPLVMGIDLEKEKTGRKMDLSTLWILPVSFRGIPLNYYVAVDMDVVKEIVDAIGGVEMETLTILYRKHGRDRRK